MNYYRIIKLSDLESRSYNILTYNQSINKEIIKKIRESIIEYNHSITEILIDKKHSLYLRAQGCSLIILYNGILNEILYNQVSKPII
jgi:L-cysteine desulfidase